jgi:hypothetical protein
MFATTTFEQKSHLNVTALNILQIKLFKSVDMIRGHYICVL